MAIIILVKELSESEGRREGGRGGEGEGREGGKEVRREGGMDGRVI